MIECRQYKEKIIGIFGGGRTGLATAKTLLKSGATVIADDDNVKGKEVFLQEGITVIPYAQWTWSLLDGIVVSPGVNKGIKPHPIVIQAKNNNIPMISDMDMLWEARPNALYVGITGTNGKTTTTMLIGHILQTAGKEVATGGNNGIAALSMPPLSQEGIYVLELSSFQIQAIEKLKLARAVLLNISPDHLEEHGDIPTYASIKEKIFHQLASDGIAYLGIDDIYTQDMERRTQAITISSNAQRGNVCIVQGRIMRGDEILCTVADLPDVVGKHQWQNVLASILVCESLGVPISKSIDAIKTFQWLPHRQELVRVIGNVSFINDSKGTNVDATYQALYTKHNPHWIVGGVFKGGTFGALMDIATRIKKAYIIGKDTTPWEDFCITCNVPYEISGNLETATVQAWHNARKEKAEAEAEVVLSPACASFDQFKNYEDRGNQFKSLVFSIKENVKEHAHDDI